MLALALAAVAATAPIDYTVSAAAAPRGAPIVTVALTFIGDADGETVVELPSHWAGSDELWRALSRPTVIGGRLATAARPEEWRIRHRPGARITVRYTVADAQPGLPAAQTYEKARPEVNAAWVQLHGEGVIAIPAGRQQAPARFRWGSLPAGWRAVADVERSAEPLTPNAIGGGIFMGGRGLRIATRQVGGASLRIASIGPLPGGDAAFDDRLERLIRTENAMLRAPAIPFLVTAIPLTGGETGAIDFGGSGRTAGFALAMTDNVGASQLTRLLAHEYAHRWFGVALGRIPEGAGPYWLTEGVNDWFAARAMVAAGLWTPAEWVTALNDKLLGYGVSRARGLSDAEITAQFWTNPEAMQVQYDRGQLLALLIDRRLDGGLIKILRAMVAARGDEEATAKFIRLVDAQQPGATAAARSAVTRPLAADALAPCGRIAMITQPRYDRGFDFDDKRVVTNVRGDAAAAGVRPGWRYARRVSTRFDDSVVPLVAEFDTGSGLRTLQWLPRGTEPVTFQRLDGIGMNEAACRKMIVGSAPH